MDDRSELLKQLRIERGEPAPDSGRGRRAWWVAGGALLLLALGAGVWGWLRPVGIAVRVVVAQSAGPTAAGALLDASGYVVARRQATVSAKITGKVVELLIEEGRHVDDGQVVARLDDTNARAALDQARAQLASARAALAEGQVSVANAGRDLARKKGLVADQLISVADLDTAQTALDADRAHRTTLERNVDEAQRTVEVAQRNEDDTVVRAPFAGVITVKAAQVGEIVSPFSAGGGFTRTGIGTIVDMDSLEVEVDVNENFINRVHPEQPVRVRLNAYPDWDIPAAVIAVIPTADRSKATVKVRVGFHQKDARILPEMGARVAFLSEAASLGAAGVAAGVSVPAAAVQASGETGTVFLIRGDTVERRAVKLGAADADSRVILSGVSAGERLAIGDFSRLADGVRIRIQQQSD